MIKADLNPPKVLRASRAGVQARYFDTEDLPKRTTWFQRHRFQFGLGMLLMLTLWYTGTTYVLPFVQNTLNRWNCGTDLICQYNFDVGHGGTSHFLTEYWHGQAIEGCN